MAHLDLMRMPAPTLLDSLEEASAEKGILVADNASVEELRNAQRTIDQLKEEINRRMSW